MVSLHSSTRKNESVLRTTSYAKIELSKIFEDDLEEEMKVLVRHQQQQAFLSL